jgi:lipopolysaccharide/colanic/teichoic acid biosynthesis glycosyltransferase
MLSKRLFDIIFAGFALAVLWPLIALLALAIWGQDGRSPFYVSRRVGRGNRDFPMIKLRTMIVGADRVGASSASRSDDRITPFGRYLRRWKLDELPQFLNVLAGHMSIVGPRPNVRQGGVDRYTMREMALLAVRPGLTDLASIVFADEAEILEGASDVQGTYDLLIRPWKCRLGLLYIERRTLAADVALAALTVVAIAARPVALSLLDGMLLRWGADTSTRELCLRQEPLRAFTIEPETS